ncbi:hypothetical protein FHS20_004940 [Phyllobacterium endophyticum]|nr:hypothetical protein [Phyllobacterium endophyticum]
MPGWLHEERTLESDREGGRNRDRSQRDGYLFIVDLFL